MNFPALLNVPTEIQVSEGQLADMLETVLVQKYEIPIGDLDLQTFQLTGKWTICCTGFDNHTDVADCGTKVSIVSYNEDAALLFDAIKILRESGQ